MLHISASRTPDRTPCPVIKMASIDPDQWPSITFTSGPLITSVEYPCPTLYTSRCVYPSFSLWCLGVVSLCSGVFCRQRWLHTGVEVRAGFSRWRFSAPDRLQNWAKASKWWVMLRNAKTCKQENMQNAPRRNSDCRIKMEKKGVSTHNKSCKCRRVYIISKPYGQNVFTPDWDDVALSSMLASPWWRQDISMLQDFRAILTQVCR